MSQLIELRGKVDNALTKKNTFRLIQSETGARLTILVDQKVSFREGDSICCRCEELPCRDTWRLVEVVHVELGQDENTFISMLYRALPGGGMVGKNAKTLYKYFCDLLKLDAYREYETPSGLVSFLSESYLRAKDKENSPPVRVLCEARTMISGKRRAILNAEQAGNFLAWWAENYDMRRLYCLGLTFEEIDAAETRPYKLYQRLLRNPYTVPQISFAKCEAIDRRTGRIPNKNDVVCGNIVRTLAKNVQKKNWSCTPLDEIERNMCWVITDAMRKTLEEEFRLVFDDVPIYADNDAGRGTTDEYETRIYFKRHFKAERGVIRYLLERLRAEQDDLGAPIFDGEVELDEWQRSAVEMALKNNVCILCGSAGSGKTRTLGQVIRNLELRGRRVVVTSFTGKAVSRAMELNDLSEDMAATTHRILYGRGPQEFDDVVLEESGMYEMMLLYQFIRAFGERKFRVLFVGDPTQLLPIGWGTPFASMINSRSIPKVELKSNHRVKTTEGEADGIILNAQNIAHWPRGEEFVYTQTPNFRVHRSGIDKVFEIMEKAKADGKGPRDVTILCPQDVVFDGKKRFRQTRKINAYCSMLWNQGRASVTESEHTDPKTQEKYIPLWREGDRVMVTSNVYDGVDIFNGQEGIITKVHENAIEVGFTVSRIVARTADGGVAKIPDPINKAVTHKVQDEVEVNEKTARVTYLKVVRFPFTAEKKKKKALRVNGGGNGDGGELTTRILTLCYAITIHKSQGSEWNHVLFIVPSGIDRTGNFFNIGMCYTAITRAAREVDLVDPGNRTNEAIAKRPPRRCDSFEYILKHELERLSDYVAFTFERGNCEDEYQIDDAFFDDEDW